MTILIAYLLTISGNVHILMLDAWEMPAESIEAVRFVKTRMRKALWCASTTGIIKR